MSAAGGLKGKVALITGAGRGIGAATARHLAELGASVAVTDVVIDGAQDVADEIMASGGDAVAIALDCGVADSIAAGVDEAAARLGGLDLLDHNAGWTSFSRDIDAESVDLDVWQQVLDINVRGGLLLFRAALPHFRRRGGGAVVFISSGSAATGELRRVAYGVSKAGVEQLVRHLGARYGAEGIRTNAIAPGFIMTQTAASAIDEESRDLLATQNPLKRLGTPEDIASVVGFLLSDAAGFVNGQVLRVDGGLTISPRLG